MAGTHNDTLNCQLRRKDVISNNPDIQRRTCTLFFPSIHSIILILIIVTISFPLITNSYIVIYLIWRKQKITSSVSELDCLLSELRMLKSKIYNLCGVSRTSTFIIVIVNLRFLIIIKSIGYTV